MKKRMLMMILGVWLALCVQAQCSICTKTAQQLGEGPAKGLNKGILYLMVAPLGIAGFIGYTWWRREKTLP